MTDSQVAWGRGIHRARLGCWARLEGVNCAREVMKAGGGEGVRSELWGACPGVANGEGGCEAEAAADGSWGVAGSGATPRAAAISR